jgi:hypothetical protein
MPTKEFTFKNNIVALILIRESCNYKGI